MADWEAIVERRERELSSLRANATPIEACDVGLRFQAEDWARERLHEAEMEMIAARRRSQFVMTNWDETEAPCLLLGISDGVATVRFEDGHVQTMDVEHFFLNAR